MLPPIFPACAYPAQPQRPQGPSQPHLLLTQTPGHCPLTLLAGSCPQGKRRENPFPQPSFSLPTTPGARLATGPHPGYQLPHAKPLPHLLAPPLHTARPLPHFLPRSPPPHEHLLVPFLPTDPFPYPRACLLGPPVGLSPHPQDPTLPPSAPTRGSRCPEPADRGGRIVGGAGVKRAAPPPPGALVSPEGVGIRGAPFADPPAQGWAGGGVRGLPALWCAGPSPPHGGCQPQRCLVLTLPLPPRTTPLTLDDFRFLAVLGRGHFGKVSLGPSPTRAHSPSNPPRASPNSFICSPLLWWEV